MITVRPFGRLGQVRPGAAVLHCHFAFDTYQDTENLHDGRLRAVNAVTLPGGEIYRLGTEQNVDIASWVTEGELVSRCDDFPPETIGARGLHVLSAARGCTAPAWEAGCSGASFVQFWFLPDVEGGEPTQEARSDSLPLDDGSFRILASGFPEDDPERMGEVSDGSPVVLRARARLLSTVLPAGEGACYQTTAGRSLYLVVIEGSVSLGDTRLQAGDGARIDGEDRIVVMAEKDSTVLLADTTAG